MRFSSKSSALLEVKIDMFEERKKVNEINKTSKGEYYTLFHKLPKK